MQIIGYCSKKINLFFKILRAIQKKRGRNERRGKRLAKDLNSVYNRHMFTEEKKVEYIELIYDLIFVYLIGRSNELLHDMEGGFFTFGTFLTYLISALAILQIWYMSTLFINRYGSNRATDYLGLFINMYLLYYMAEGTRAEWGGYYMRYNIAWGLILVNLALQYLIHWKKQGQVPPWEAAHIKSRMISLLIQAGLVFLSIPVYYLLHFPLSWVSLVAGFVVSFFTRKIDVLVPVNFEHLTERVMLYTVLTFGEMIVSVAVYFEGVFSMNTLYFSIMAFLIVAGMFLSYGLLYDRIIDRNMHNTGSGYMLLHIVLLMALNCVTAALEYMPDPEVNEIAKAAMITIAFLIYYVFLFIIAEYAGDCNRPKRPLILRMIITSVVFAALMAATYRNGAVSIAVSAVYIFGMFGWLIYEYRNGKCRNA